MADELFKIQGDAPAVGELKFWSILGHESLSRAAHYELSVLSENRSIAAADVLGYAFDVVLAFQDADQAWHQRHCQGHAVRFLRVRQVGRYFEYRITLRSWFWLLTKRRNSRIHQDLPVLDVLDATFEDSPIKRYKKTRADDVMDPHKAHRYCVQFEESDYHFASRLLEEEGIYYWFDAHDAPGTMMLADTSSVAHGKLPVQPTLSWQPADRGEARYNEISAWVAGQRLDTGKWAATDSDFKNIRWNLTAQADVAAEHELADFEEFEFPGDYFDADQGETVLLGPVAAGPSDHASLGTDPHRLGIDQGAVHVPKHCLQACLLNHNRSSTDRPGLAWPDTRRVCRTPREAGSGEAPGASGGSCPEAPQPEAVQDYEDA